MSDPKTALQGYVRYRAVGQVAFLLHRLTGLGVLLFLIIHIVDTAFVYFVPELYEHAIQLYRSLPFLIGEIFLVWAVFYHGLNGLRIIVFDLWKPEWWEREFAIKSVYWVLVISVLLWLPAAFTMAKHAIEYYSGG